MSINKCNKFVKKRVNKQAAEMDISVIYTFRHTKGFMTVKGTLTENSR